MAKQLDPIILNHFNNGGIADSPWSGLSNSMSELVGLDLHSTPGLVNVNQALAKESGANVTEFCKFSVAASDGKNYWFSSTSGKVWEESNGVYTMVHTTTPSAGTAYCTGAEEYNGFIYWATQSRLHKIPISGLPNWATAVEDFATLTNSAEYHPMLEVNGVLFIGDGKDVHQVDGTAFTASALDIKEPHVTKSLGQIGTDLLIGTEIAGTSGKAGIYRWDTYSISYLTFDPVPEDAVNAFLKADNFTYAQAGGAGNIYIFNGEKLELYYKIPGEYSSVKRSITHSDAVGMMNGQILFGFSNVIGNPANQGVYMIGRNSRNYRYVMDLSFPISERSGSDFVLSDIEIGSIIVRGFDVWVSWKRGSSYGVDKLDYNTKLNGAYMTSRYMVFDRPNLMTISEIITAYQSMPSSCDIDILTDVDYSGSFTLQTTTQDTDRNIKITDSARQEANIMMIKVLFTTSSNDAPTLESISVILDG